MSLCMLGNARSIWITFLHFLNFLTIWLRIYCLPRPQERIVEDALVRWAEGTVFGLCRGGFGVCSVFLYRFIYCLLVVMRDPCFIASYNSFSKWCSIVPQNANCKSQTSVPSTDRCSHVESICRVSWSFQIFRWLPMILQHTPISSARNNNVLAELTSAIAWIMSSSTGFPRCFFFKLFS